MTLTATFSGGAPLLMVALGSVVETAPATPVDISGPSAIEGSLPGISSLLLEVILMIEDDRLFLAVEARGPASDIAISNRP